MKLSKWIQNDIQENVMVFEKSKLKLEILFNSKSQKYVNKSILSKISF